MLCQDLGIELNYSGQTDQSNCSLRGTPGKLSLPFLTLSSRIFDLKPIGIDKSVFKNPKGYTLF